MKSLRSLQFSNYDKVKLRRFLSSVQHVEPAQKAGQLAADTAAKVDVPRRSLDTVLSHAGVQNIENAPMSPPLSLATTYKRPASGIYRDEDFVYSRDNTPTKSLLEETVASLELHGDTRDCSGAICCAFSSGMAGVNAIVTAHGSATTVLIPHDLYHGVPTLLEDIMKPMGIQFQRVDFTHIESVVQHAQAVTTENVIVWMETPSNPKCHVLDIEAICSTLQDARLDSKLTTVVDSTMCSPVITQPLRLGVDIVFHSATKYFGGHSDALIGVVTTSPWTKRGIELGPRLNEVKYKGGAVASPFDAWLTLRGLRTLHVRVERASQNAHRLADFLQSQESVKATHYPGLVSHPQHTIAKKQMKKYFGGVFSFEMGTDVEAMAVVGALRIAQRATSLGGTETLVEHRASIEPPQRIVSPPGLVRVSVGLEDVDDLIEDFRTALEIAKIVSQEV